MGRSFVGDWQTTGYGDESKGPWAGDEVYVETMNGGIVFKLAESEPAARSSGSSGGLGGLLKGIFGGGKREPPKPLS